MANPSNPGNGVRWVEVDADRAGQRLDNFLRHELKGVPRSRIYRLLRKGEVRVNKGRCKPHRKLAVGDTVRIPPVRQSERDVAALPPGLVRAVGEAVIHEDERFLAIDKPAGVAVHRGSGLAYGADDLLRAARPELGRLELVHRLDRETSGCLLFAKGREPLLAAQAALRERAVRKVYLALVKGRWEGGERRVDVPLAKNVLQGGERMVTVDPGGKTAVSRFRPVERFADATLVEVVIETGRTHQIRVHAAHVGHPLAGDAKYGDRGFNRHLRALGLKRLFLHARALEFDDPGGVGRLALEAPLEAGLESVLNILRETDGR